MSLLHPNVPNNHAMMPYAPYCLDLLLRPNEDSDEMNPVEYAIMSTASLKTVQLLQNAAAKHLHGTSTSMCPGPTMMSL